MGLFCAVPPQAEEGSRRPGLGRYIKKKKLEPLETYVPAVVAARNQLQRAGSIMSEPSSRLAIAYNQRFGMESKCLMILLLGCACSIASKDCSGRQHWYELVIVCLQVTAMMKLQPA